MMLLSMKSLSSLSVTELFLAHLRSHCCLSVNQYFCEIIPNVLFIGVGVSPPVRNIVRRFQSGQTLGKGQRGKI